MLGDIPFKNTVATTDVSNPSYCIVYLHMLSCLCD